MSQEEAEEEEQQQQLERLLDLPAITADKKNPCIFVRLHFFLLVFNFRVFLIDYGRVLDGVNARVNLRVLPQVMRVLRPQAFQLVVAGDVHGTQCGTAEL